jgi:hypothetical protein
VGVGSWPREKMGAEGPGCAGSSSLETLDSPKPVLLSAVPGRGFHHYES